MSSLKSPKFGKGQKVDYRGETATVLGVKEKKDDFLYKIRTESGKKVKAYEGELTEQKGPQ